MQARPDDRVRARDESSNSTVVGVLSTEHADSVWGAYTRYLVTADDGGNRVVDADTIHTADSPEEPDEEALSNEELVARLDTFLQPLFDAGWELAQDEWSDDSSANEGPSVFRDLNRGNKVVQIEYLLGGLPRSRSGGRGARPRRRDVEPKAARPGVHPHRPPAVACLHLTTGRETRWAPEPS